MVPGDVIEAQWANATTSDLADGLTQSLDRSGRGAMLAPLILSSDAITQPRQAVSKAYVDNFLAYATGMPMGAITAYATNTVPAGWLLCNGQAVSRTTYADLFTTIGTIYGVGDGTTTFNVPDLRNEFIRGLGGSNVLGTKYVASLACTQSGGGLTSGLESSSHTHGFTTGGVSANATHSHSITDPGHTHSLNSGGANAGNGAFADATFRNNIDTGSKQTGIGIVGTNTDHTHSGTTAGVNANHNHVVSGDTASTGGTETVPNAHGDELHHQGHRGRPGVWYGRDGDGSLCRASDGPTVRGCDVR